MPEPLGFTDEGASSTEARQVSARILPVTPSFAAVELGQIDHDRAPVLDAMREGYASVLITLADPYAESEPPTRSVALGVARRQITDRRHQDRQTALRSRGPQRHVLRATITVRW